MRRLHTTLTLFNYAGLRNRFWALSQMGLAPAQLATTPGLQFGRLMGSGGGNGFSVSPNWGVYAWLGHWESRAAADDFFGGNAWYVEARKRCQESLTVHLLPTMTHGEWGGGNPFVADRDAYDPSAPVAVITRATIHPSKLPDFWRYVPKTSASVYDHPERLLSIGVGEYPIFMQATFSLWKTGKAMQAFAYRSDHHKEVVKLTRERQWYKEEMFTRFAVLELEGSWAGLREPEALFS
ncbi:hypothetical protein A3850_007010 [Lewinella sp. 4G2]|nr:hypothetical protein A3850_007010 [Lewinella sp. 4G2]